MPLPEARTACGSTQDLLRVVPALACGTSLHRNVGVDGVGDAQRSRNLQLSDRVGLVEERVHDALVPALESGVAADGFLREAHLELVVIEGGQEEVEGGVGIEQFPIDLRYE